MRYYRKADQIVSVYSLKIKSIDGQDDILSSVDGKVCLFVNIVSKAGYEPKCSKVWSYARTMRQFWELQQLHELFGEDFSVVGFPCNQFYKMEPLDNEQINAFIKETYPFVTFPITEKIDVNGPNEHPVYTYLKGPETRRKDDTRADNSESASAGQNLANQAISRIPSNFEKIIVSREGQHVMRFRFTNWPMADESLINESDLTIKSAISMLLPN
jgi:glutathione peroxidase